MAACAYTLLAAFVVMRAAGQAGTRPPAAAQNKGWPSITVLKPLHGAEPELYTNLASALQQDYAGPVQVIFGVGERSDPAVSAVRQIVADYPSAAIDLVVDPRRHGQNGKISNLINMAEHAHHDVIVLADSDMKVGPDYLAKLVTALEEPGVGAVTCLYRGLALSNLWSRLAAQWIDDHFLPNVLVGMALGLAKPCFGSTIALRRETLDRVGGFMAFKDVLADDYALGDAVRRLGLKVSVPKDLVLGHLCAATSPAAVLRQELRWARTIRSVDPLGFIGSVVTHAIPLATIAAVWSDFSAGGTFLLAVAVASRLLVQLLMARFLRRSAKGLILGPVRDYAAFLIFVLSFWPGSINWRGERFALRSDGTLAPPDTAGS